MSALSETVKSMGKGRIATMALVSAILLGFFLYLSFHVSNGNMIPLYSNLSLDDSAKIVAELEKTGTPYELVAGGTQVLVPSDKMLRLRMSMASESLPSGGSVVGYEIFDRSESFGSSNFVMNVNMVRALEGELSRTIASLSGVENARVHLVMAKRELFSREKDKPSASVTIKMRGGKQLERSEVNAISHLVASAVPGLEPSRVTIVDNFGKLLARGDGSDSADASANTAQEFRIAYENRLRQTIEDMLEKVVGNGKVDVQVAADINFDRIVTNSEKYDPDGQVARSTQSTSETDKSQDKTGKDAVTVANNLPQTTSGDASNNATSNHAIERSDETTNFEISKTVQNHVSEGGNVKKISIAVLVDGTYTMDADNKEIYAPRTDAELAQIKQLVTTAIGYDEKRGDTVQVVNMKFTETEHNLGPESFFDRFKVEMQSIIQTLIIAVVAILAILLVLRPAVMQLIKQGQSPNDRVTAELAALQGGAMGALPGAGGMPGMPGVPGMAGGPGGMGGADEPDTLIDVANVKGGMKSSTMKKINEIVDKYPEETMGVVRQWLIKAS